MRSAIGEAYMDIGLQLPPVYEILGGPYKGGMGCVWKARHREWDTLLAVKQPINDTIDDPLVQERFLRESELWVSLGLHEHIVFCHYVRNLDGVFTVFAEWMEGGSLQEQIVSGKLYEAARDDSLTLQLRLLDLGIQIARGMIHAHGKKLIHRDLKPANVLFSTDGTAKVTDFGLAVLYGGEDISKGYGTAAYAAPEQQRGETVSMQTDLWSFGVMMLELFLGERRWTNSLFIPTGLQNYLGDCKVPVPREVRELIQRCCDSMPQRRPRDFREAEQLLLSCWQSLSGREYPRKDAGATNMKADSWNNRALSYLDLDRTEEAENCWEKALRADPEHMAALYNHTLFHWRTGILDDVDAMRCLQNAYNSAPCRENADLLIRFFTERQSAEPIRRLREIYREDVSVPPVPPSWDSRCLVATKPVRRISCTGNGAVFFYRDGTAEYRCMEKKETVLSLDIGTDRGNGAVMLANGAFCIACDAGLRLLDKTGKYSKSIHVAEGAVRDILLCSSDCVLIHVSRQDGTVNKEYAIRLRLSDGERESKIRFSRIDPNLFIPMRYGRELIVSLKDQLMRIGLDGGDILNSFVASGIVRCAALSKDERMLAICADDTVNVLLCESSEVKRTIRSGSISELYFLHDDLHLLTVGEDRSVRIWEISSGRCIRTFPPQRGRITAFELSKSEKYYLSADHIDGVLLQHIPSFEEHALWKLSSVSDARGLQENERIFRLLLQEASDNAKAGKTADALHCIDLARKLDGYERHPAYLKLNAMLGRKLKVRRLLSVWNRYSAKKDADGHSMSDPLTCTNQNGNIVLKARYDGEIRVCGPNGEKSIRSGIRGVSAASLSTDGKWFILGTYDGRLALFDVRSGALLWQRRHGNNMVSCLTFDPAGDYIAVGHAEGTILICHPSNGKILKVLTGHASPVIALRFSPDGLMLRSDAEDGSLCIWQFDYEYGL